MDTPSIKITEQRTRETEPFPDMVWVPGGTFTMGSDNHYPEESPSHEVTVDGFWMDKFTITNKEFKKFADATNYITVAERPLNPEDYPGAPLEALVPGSLVFFKPATRVNLNIIANWWSYLPGACWRHPQGLTSSLEGKWDHPVVHIAWEDVETYAAWVGKELPTEAEWEFACRGGMDGKIYEWGDEQLPNGKMMANFWMGEFPWLNLSSHGYEGTSPVGSFSANNFGLHDMTGNVWEWTCDWYESNHSHDKKKACCIPQNPRGGSKDNSYDPHQPEIKIPRKVLKGGSHLCGQNYCYRYRPAARQAQMLDTGAAHIGFRCIVRNN